MAKRKKVSKMECQDCGKPYMAGLKFTMKGNYVRCQMCYDKVVKERKECFKDVI